jgi:hypothetical protein
VSERPSGRRRLARALGVLLGAALLVFLVERIGWDYLVATLRRMGVAGLAAVVALGLVEALLDGAALWRTLLGRVPLRWVVGSNGAGALVNMAIPYEAGEVAKGFLLGRRAPDTVAGLIVWNYVWKLSRPLGALVAFGAGSLLAGGLSNRALALVGAGCALAFLPYLVLRAVVRARPAEGAVRLVGRLPPLRAASERFLARAVRLDGDVNAFLAEHRAAFRHTLALQVGARLLSAAAIGTALALLAPDVHPAAAGVVYATLSVSDYVLALLPARLGVTEGASYVLFGFLGLDPALGAVVGIVMRIRAVASNALLAGLLLR